MIQEVTVTPVNTPEKSRIDHAANLLFACRVNVVLCALFLPISLAVSNILFVVAAFLITISVGPHGLWGVLKTHPVAPTFLAYFLLLALGLSYTSAPWPEALSMFAKYNKLWTIIPLFALAYDEKWFRYTVLAFVLSMLLTMILGFLKILGVWNLSPGMGPASVFARHITTSWFMSIASFFVFNYFLVDIRKRWPAIIPLSLMVFYTLFFNDGRTGYVVLIVLFVYALWWHIGVRGNLVGEYYLTDVINDSLLCFTQFS